MKVFFSIVLLALTFFGGMVPSQFSNDHLKFDYPEDWIVRPVSNTFKEYLILEREELSIWSPLKPDEDRKTLRLTVPSTIYYKKNLSLKKIEKELWKAAKEEFKDLEEIYNEDGEKQGLAYRKIVFSHRFGAGFEITELYLFSIQETPYILYMTSSRKEYNRQKVIWGDIWTNLVIQ